MANLPQTIKCNGKRYYAIDLNIPPPRRGRTMKDYTTRRRPRCSICGDVVNVEPLLSVSLAEFEGITDTFELGYSYTVLMSGKEVEAIVCDAQDCVSMYRLAPLGATKPDLG